MNSPLLYNCDPLNLANWAFRRVRKRPIVVHAYQMNQPEGFMVTTPEGVMTGRPGDYLMVGVEGEKYPCRKDIFEKTYESAD